MNPGIASVLRAVVVVELELVEEELELLEEVLEVFGRDVVGCGVTPAVVVGDNVVVGAVVEEVDDDEEDEDEVVDSVVVVVSSATAEEPRLNRTPSISTIAKRASDTRERARSLLWWFVCAGRFTTCTIVGAFLTADGEGRSRSSFRRSCDAAAWRRRMDTLPLGCGPPGDHPYVIPLALRAPARCGASRCAGASHQQHRANPPIEPGRTLLATTIRR